MAARIISSTRVTTASTEQSLMLSTAEVTAPARTAGSSGKRYAVPEQRALRDAVPQLRLDGA